MSFILSVDGKLVLRSEELGNLDHTHAKFSFCPILGTFQYSSFCLCLCLCLFLYLSLRLRASIFYH